MKNLATYIGASILVGSIAFNTQAHSSEENQPKPSENYGLVQLGDEFFIRCSGRRTEVRTVIDGLPVKDAFSLQVSKVIERNNLDREPADLELSVSAFPNPSNNFFNLEVTIPYGSTADVSIYDVSGRLVKNLSNDYNKCSDCLFWDGTNSNGTGVAPGIYFLRASTSEKEKTTEKLVKLK